MTAGLSPALVVNATVTLEQAAVPAANFGAALKVGSTEGVIDVSERIRVYNDDDEVADDFGASTPEYDAALKHFGQSPRPALLYIGRFAQNPTAAVLHGAALTPAQQLLSNFQNIANGALLLRIGGVPIAVQGINFTQAVTMTGVAYALQSAVPNNAVTVTWNPGYGRFDILTAATGPAASIGYALPPAAAGSITYQQNPVAGAVDTFNGTTVTYVSTNPQGNQVLIGASLAATLQNLAIFLGNSRDPQIVKFNSNVVGNALELTAVAPGSAGNALTLSSTAGQASGATLAGGAGTDVSALLGLSQAAGALIPVAGVAAEAPADAAAAMVNAAGFGTQWYSLEFALGAELSLADEEAVAEFIEAQSPSRIFGGTITTTDVLVPGVSSDKASVLGSLNLSRTYKQYSSTSPHAASSLFARIATVDWDAVDTAITLMFKQEPGVAAELLTATQAASLKAKHCNVFAQFSNGAMIIKDGTMINGDYIDERVGLDWLQNAVETDLFNVLYTRTTKIKQTDADQQILLTQANATLTRGVRNGLLAEGIWTGPSFGTLKTGAVLVGGFYCWSDSYATQSQADRQARKAMPIQIAAKLAGAVHEVDALITVVR